MKRILRVLMLLSLITIPTLVQAAISVTFTSSVANRQTCLPSMTSSFTASTTGCSGTPTYTWYFIKNPALSSSDTTILTGTSAIRTFNGVGSWDVVVRAVCGTDTAYSVANDYIQLTPQPVIDFTSSAPLAPGLTCVGTVTFTNTSTGDTFCTPRVWQWIVSRPGYPDMTASTTNATFNFTDSGDYSITLRYIGGPCACVDDTVKMISVRPYPTACFNRTDFDDDCHPPVDATFDAGCSHDAVTYAWSFTGLPGTTSSSPSSAAIFAAPGNYSITLTTTNAAGCSTTSAPLGIHVGNLVAYFRPIPDTVCEDAIINVTDSSWVDVIPPMVSTFMAYDALGVPNGPYPGPTAAITMNFGTGLITIRDIINNGNGCQATMDRFVYVRPKPTAVVNIDDADRYKCTPSINAHFHSTPVVAANTYAWTFEGTSTFTGTGTVGANPTHNYTALGIYSPTLTVTDIHGCTNTTEATGIVRILPPVIGVDRYVDSGCTPVNACFTTHAIAPPAALVPGFIAILDSVTFGDGSPTMTTATYGDSFCHTYFTGGTFTTRVYWHTHPAFGNCSGVDTTVVVIGAVVPPHDFTTQEIDVDGVVSTLDYHADSICPYHGIFFRYTRVDTTSIATWRVQTFPGSTGTVVVSDTASFVYTTPSLPIPPGITDTPWRYILQTCLNGCCVYDTARIFVFPPPISTNSLNARINNCSNKNLVTFSCLGTTGAVSYQWNFGDGSPVVTTSVDTVQHLFSSSAPINPTIVVTAFGPAPGNCPVQDTLSYFRVISDTAWRLSDTALCVGQSINVVGPHQLDTTAYPTYNWFWGDAPAATTINADSLASHMYSAAGVYTVSLIFQSPYGCDYNGGKKIVKVYGPNMNFTVSPNPLCAGDVASVTDLSTFPLSSIYRRSISWDFPSSLPTPVSTSSAPITHMYPTAGVYTIAISDTDASPKHCGAITTATINVVRVRAYFTTPDTIGACAGVSVGFHDTNTHCTYAWNFGDGVTTTASTATQDITHTYSANGTYSVTVTVVADGTAGIPAGCTGTFTRVITLTNISGIDINHFADTTSACPPLLVAVGPTTTPTSYLYTYTWTISAPDSLVYSGAYLFTNLTHSGDHLVSLIATSPRGCKDTAYVHFIVGGPTGTLSISSTSGCAPTSLVVTFNSTGTVPPGANYTWNTCPDGAITTSTPSVTLSYSVPGVYCPPSLFIESGGCAVPFDDLTDSIRIFGTPTVSVTHLPRICYGASDSLYASGADTYSWYGPTGLICTGCSFVTVSPLANTTYTVVGSNTAGCSDSETVVVHVDPPLNVAITGPDSMCIGDSTILTASGGSGTYFWFASPVTGGGEMGISCNVCNPVIVRSIITRTYFAMSTDINGCRDTAEHVVVINPLPVLTFSPNPAFVCDGSSTQVTVSGAAKYLWTPRIGLSCDSCANPFITLDNNLIYSVTGTTQYGCVDSITIPVEVYHRTVTAIRSDTIICYGDQARLWAEGGISYKWRPGNSLSDSTIYNPIATPTVTTTYTVAIHENVCFDTTRTVKVTVIPTPIIKVPPTTIIVAGNSVQLYGDALNAVTLTSWAWTPADSTLTCTDCPHPIATPVVTTTYTVSASTIEGCTGYNTVTIKLLCQTDQVFIPNTFTPNGDGINDRFYVSGKGLGLIKRMAVYNRWGELMYEAYNIHPNDVGPGWDGTFRGEVLPPDVYVYVLDVMCSTGEPFVFRGDISLVR